MFVPLLWSLIREIGLVPIDISLLRSRHLRSAFSVERHWK
jgi:hypothetical protein